MHFHWLIELLRSLDSDTRSMAIAVALGIPLAGTILHVVSRRQDRLLKSKEWHP